MKYYTYQHLKADDGEIFYVGKGTRRRAWGKDNRNNHWHNTVNKHGFVVEILAYFKIEQDALDFEIIKIAEYRSSGHNLVNQTNGGGGVSGYKPTESHRNKTSEALKGKKKPPRSAEHTAKIIKARPSTKGKTNIEIHGEEKAAEMKKARAKTVKDVDHPRKGKTNEEYFGEERAEEIKTQVSKSRTGTKKSAESKEKTRKSMLGKNLGKKQTREHIDKVIESKKRNANIRRLNAIIAEFNSNENV